MDSRACGVAGFEQLQECTDYPYRPTNGDSSLKGGETKMTAEEVSEKMERMIVEVKQELAAQKEQIKGVVKRVDEQAKLTESVHELAGSVMLLAQKQEHTVEKLNAVSKDVEELKQKPVKRMDDVWKVVITVVVTAAITLVLTQIGLK